MLLTKLKARKNLHLPLKYNSEFKVEFSHNNYITQSILINTYTVPKNLQREKIALGMSIILIEKNKAISDPISHTAMKLLYLTDPGQWRSWGPPDGYSTAGTYIRPAR